MSLVSIVIPAYNASEYITEAIGSITAQDYPDCEIIIVDDGSTDPIQDVLKKYVDAGQVRYFYQENAGPGAARNKGLREASGKYISFLDADDELVAGSLLKRVCFLEDHPDVGMVFTDFFKLNAPDDIRVHFEDNNFLQKFQRAILFSEGNSHIFGDKYFECALEHNPFILTSTVMIRASVVREIGLFNVELKVAEDVDYWLRVCRKYQTGFLNEPLTKYNNFRSVLTKNAKKFFEDSISFYCQLFKDIKGVEKYNKPLREKISVLEFNYGYHLVSNNMLNLSRDHFWKSFLWKKRNPLAIKWIVLSFIPRKILGLIKK